MNVRPALAGSEQKVFTIKTNIAKPLQLNSNIKFNQNGTKNIINLKEESENSKIRNENENIQIMKEKISQWMTVNGLPDFKVNTNTIAILQNAFEKAQKEMQLT